MGPDALRQLFHDRGLKLTRSRQAILEVLTKTPGHLKVAEVHRRARRIDPGIGLASVYRTLDLLAHLQLAKPLHMDHRHRHYVRATGQHGHHLVCTGCGLAVEFADCQLERLAQTLARRTRFRIDGHFMEFFGLCAKCRSEPKSAPRRAGC
jgi:Fur family ferric uptake transcriptional regulator